MQQHERERLAVRRLAQWVHISGAGMPPVLPLRAFVLSLPAQHSGHDLQVLQRVLAHLATPGHRAGEGTRLEAVLLWSMASYTATAGA
jgi:hypothetical protein